MDNVKGFLSTAFIAAAIAWLGMIWYAEADRKLEVSCKPLEWTLGQVVKIATGLIGFTPAWTADVRQWLEGGCYYFFSTIIFSGADDIRKPVDTGGGIYQ